MPNKDLKFSLTIENNVTNLDEAEQYIGSLEEMGFNIEHLRKRSAALVDTWDDLSPAERGQQMRRLREAMVSTADGTLDLEKETAELERTTQKASKATSRLRKESGLLDDAYGKLRSRVIATGAAIAGYFSVRKLSGLFTNAVSGAASLEAQLSKVQAVSKATDEQMSKIADTASLLGGTTKYTATQAAEGFEILARAGLDASESITAIPAVLNLAQAAGIELAESAGYITKAIAGMNLTMSDSGRVADVLAQAAASANTDVSGLGQALSYAAPSASALGLSLEETVAIIGKFADAGIDASRAGTALNSILAQFSNSASKFRQELSAIGITTNDFSVALRELARSGDGGKKAILAVGQEAGPALKALIAQGIPALDELVQTLRDANGVSSEMAKTMGDNLEGAMVGLGSAWDSLKNNLGKPLLEPIKEQVNALAETFRGWVADGTIKSIGETLASAFQTAATVVRDFGGVLAKIVTVMGVVKLATTAYTATLGKFTAATTAGATASKVLLTTLRGFARLGLGLVLAGLFDVISALIPKTHAWQQSLDDAFNSLIELQTKAAQGIDIKTGDLAPFNEQMAEIDRQIEALSNKDTGVFDFAKDAIPWLDSNNQQLIELLQKKDELKNQEIQLNAQIKANKTAETQRAEKAKAHAEEQKQIAAENIALLEKRKAEFEAMGDTESDYYKYVVSELNTLNKTLDDTASKTRQAFEAAGLSMNELFTGITDSEQSVIDSLQNGVDYINGLGLSAKQTGEMINRFLGGSFKALQTPEAITAAIAELEKLENKTPATAYQIDALKRKLYETNPAFKSLSDSIAKATQTEPLEKYAAAAKKAFEGGDIDKSQYETLLADLATKTQALADTEKTATKAKQQKTQATQADTAATKANADATQENTEAVQDNAQANALSSESAKRSSAVQMKLGKELASNTNTWKIFNKTLKEAYKVEGYYSFINAHEAAWDAVRKLRGEIQRAAAAEEILAQKVDAGTVTMADLSDVAQRAAAGIGRLDDAQLNKLNATLDKARNKIKALKDEARQTAQDTEDRLLEATGSESDKINRRFEREIKDLQSKSAKSNVGSADYERAIANLRQLQQIELKKAAKRQEQQQETEQKRRAVQEPPFDTAHLVKTIEQHEPQRQRIDAKQAAEQVAKAFTQKIDEAEQRAVKGSVDELANQLNHFMRGQNR